MKTKHVAVLEPLRERGSNIQTYHDEITFMCFAAVNASLRCYLLLISARI